MTASPDTTYSSHSEPANWPEVAQGHEVPMVCDWCHASLDEIAIRGHYNENNCNNAGVHMHDIDLPVEKCCEWRLHAGSHERAVLRDQEVPHALYRFFDAAGQLLYVGLTVDPGSRWKNHSKRKTWWYDVANSTMEWFPSRKAVEAAEILAIRNERPLHNVLHNIANAASATGGKTRKPTLWSFTGRRSGHTVETPLWLYWELDGDSISDDYDPRTMPAAILWDMWRMGAHDPRAEDAFGPGALAIHWFVEGDGVIEAAPYQEPENAPEFDFLSDFTAPVNASTGERMRWERMTVVDKVWRRGPLPQGTHLKGGFIQEVTGWKPYPLQPYVTIATLEQAKHKP